jgi:hypothetical protein
MRPHIDDTSVRVLLKALPEFETNYLDLVEIYDEDLTPQVVFSELAEMVSDLLEEDEDEELLESCFQAVETVATTPGVDVAEVIGYAFLQGMRPSARELADSWAGPTTASVLQELDACTLDLGDDLLTDRDIADMEELERVGVLSPGTTERVVSLAGERAEPAPRR